MNELIAVRKESIGNAVSARELYLGLGLDKSNWAKWFVTNIEENGFFTQGVDFIKLPKKNTEQTPNPTQDFAISISFAVSLVSFAKSVSSKVKMEMLTALGASDRVCISSRAEIEFLDVLEKVIEPMGFTMTRQVNIPNKKGTSYRIDAVINELKIALEYDEDHHKHRVADDENRQNEIQENSSYWFVRLSSGESHLFNVGVVMRTIVLYSEISCENLYL